MSIINILDKIKDNDNIDTDLAQTIIDFDNNELIELQKLCLDIKEKNFGKELLLHYPNRRFPAISITGTHCKLNCKHCNKHYLKTMIQAPSPEALIETCKNLDQRNAIGCLISGGFDDEAKVPFEKFLNALKKIKKSTNLILNLHTGLITKSLATELGKIGIDVVSFDITADEYIIHNIYGLNKSKEDYIKSYTWLLQSKIKTISPHICIGLNPNDKLSEYRSLTLLKDFKPEIIVFIAFIPTKDTPMQDLPPPTASHISKIICLGRLMFPKSEIVLGCMRPKLKNSKVQIEKYAINSGLNRIVLPSRALVNYLLSHNYPLLKYNSCCALPKRILSKFINVD